MVKKAIFGECLYEMFVRIREKRNLPLLYGIMAFCISLLLCVGCSNNSVPTSNSDGSEKSHDKDSTCLSITEGEVLYDFGYVKPNEKHEVDFIIQNPTENDLSLRRVRSECNCMYALNPPKTIPAKGTSTLKLVFVAPVKPQCYDKKLIVQQTESRDFPLFALHVNADVGRPLICRPENIDLGTLKRQEDREVSVTISNRGSIAVRPIYATSSVDGFIAKNPRAEIPPGGELAIPLKIHLEEEAKEKRNALVNIHTDLTNQPQVAVKIQYSLENTSK